LFIRGLPTVPVGTAIPHSDKEFAISSAVAVGKLQNPVIFQNMGAPQEELDVNVIFLLAVCKGEEQVPMITAVMHIVQDVDLLEKIIIAETGKQIEEELREFCKFTV
jgi:PTS system galactitol-specific IIA component